MTIESVVLINGEMQVVKRTERNLAYLTYPQTCTPDTVTKEIYRAIDGEIVLCETIHGTVTPPQTIPGKIEWDKDDE